MNVSELINSRLSLLFIGFVLTGVVGNHLAALYQERQWKREKEIEILGRRLDETQQVVEELTLAMRNRYYLMQKVFWELESRRFEKAGAMWELYQGVKDEWNIKIYIYRNKLARLVGEELGHRLIGPENAVEREEGEIHSAFIEGHVALRTLIRYTGDESGREERNKDAHAKLDRLSKNIDAFTRELFEAYLGDYGVLHSAFSMTEDR